MRRFLTALLMLCAAQAAAVTLSLSRAEKAWVQAHPVVRIQMSDESPPFEYKVKGEYRGIAYNYLLEAARRIGVKVEVTGIPWTEALKSIQSDRRVDLVLCISPSPERARVMLFTRPYLSFPQVIFTARNHSFVSKVSDLSHSQISVERDYLMEQWLRRDLPQAQLHVTDGPQQSLQLLATGQVDAYIGNLATTTFLIDQLGLVNLEVAAPSGYENDTFCMGVRSDWPELRGMLDKAIASFSPDEERNLRDPWLAVRYEYGIRPIDVVKWVGLVALIALAFIWQLNSMVRRRTEELKQALEQKAQAQRLQAVGTLAGGIAHDFNNILAAIQGNAELALARKPEGELKQDLEVLLQASRRAADLVKQILAFSRVSNEARQPVLLRQAVSEALTLLRASIPSSIQLSSELNCDARVLAVPGDIHRILINLATNAAQAMPKGGSLYIRLKALSGATTALLSVSDNGAGMSPEQQAHIFEPFYSTRKAEGGSGMGLAVVHGLVGSMGGRIEVQSAPGQGSTFSITLPLIAEAGPDRGVAFDQTPQPGQARILLVDDEPDIVRVMQRALSMLGYQVSGFEDPLAALVEFSRDPQAFDIVISDLTMPGMNGYELAERISGLRPDMPILLCTGLNEGSGPAAQKPSLHRLLQKPVSLAELTRAIQETLELS